MDYKAYMFEREEKQAYNLFAREFLIEIILRKNKQIQELYEKINKKNMYIAKSGRRYRTIPQNIDLEVWDAMSVDERMIHLGILPEEQKETLVKYHLVCDKCGDTYWCENGFPVPKLCEKCYNITFALPATPISI
jgi:hypothetical protein